ncbi:MAG: low molecular weight protein-tyrosine-phosphatase [Bacteroidota bacterium]|nr:low molecular weight protein-tyrosine-phosphatase [Bacteroidota bacterium]
MTKVLMVCLGNICRSPVAEGVLRHIADKKGLKLLVDSAGTANYHVGESPDKRSVANAKKNGVDISMLRGRQFHVRDFDEFDHIFAMDESNLKNVLTLARNEEHKQKVELLLNTIHPNKNLPVPDPYYGTEKDFEKVFELVHKACDEFTERLKEN